MVSAEAQASARMNNVANLRGPFLFGAETLVTVEFNDMGEATELILTHEQFSTEQNRNNHEWGWNSSLDCLEKSLA